MARTITRITGAVPLDQVLHRWKPPQPPPRPPQNLRPRFPFLTFVAEKGVVRQLTQPRLSDVWLRSAYGDTIPAIY